MEYIELRLLLNKCIKGEIQLNKPITLTSRDRTETTSVTFLNHLLKYNKIEKENLFSFYFKMIDMFNKSFTELMKHGVFSSYIQNVKKEWGVTDSIILETSELGDSRKTMEELLENINTLCNQFRELDSKVRNNNMNDVLVEDEMMEHIDSFLQNIRELDSEITEIDSMLKQISQNIEQMNIGILLDLSMKDKSIYLMFSEIDEDVKLPSYINIMFLNYLYVINLIKKHIIYYKRTISKVNEISGNMGRYVGDSKDTIQSKDNLFNLNKQQTDIDSYLEGLDNVPIMNRDVEEEDVEEEDVEEAIEEAIEEEEKDVEEALEE